MTGATMLGSGERREERAEHLFEGRLSDSVRRLWLRYYPASRHARFKELLLRNIRPTDHVLEIGAGSGTANQNHFDLRGKVARYVGVDPDESVLQNPHLDEAYSCTADSLPFPDESFDVAFHYYVAEHFEKPMACHREIARVLKPGGLLLFQTPSRYWYPMLAAQVTPQWFHVAPGYLRFSRLSFLLGVLYERTIEKRFPALRGVIIGLARKCAAMHIAGRVERSTANELRPA